MNRCETCKYFLGNNDFDLCCSISHPTPKEKEVGKTFVFGHLCCDTSPACDCYKEKV